MRSKSFIRTTHRIDEKREGEASDLVTTVGIDRYQSEKQQRGRVQ
jgi:hypothetical protein